MLRLIYKEMKIYLIYTRSIISEKLCSQYLKEECDIRNEGSWLTIGIHYVTGRISMKEEESLLRIIIKMIVAA